MNTSRTIYLVDNDDSARKGLTKLFTAAGYNVEKFSSTEDFLQIQTVDISGCVVMDTWASKLSGEELHTEFEHRNLSIPVIFLSARDDEQSRDKARAAQVAGFFRKPVDGHALLDTIAWLMLTHRRDIPSKEIS